MVLVFDELDSGEQLSVSITVASLVYKAYYADVMDVCFISNAKQELLTSSHANPYAKCAICRIYFFKAKNRAVFSFYNILKIRYS